MRVDEMQAPPDIMCLACGEADARSEAGGLRCHDCEEDNRPILKALLSRLTAPTTSTPV